MNKIYLWRLSFQPIAPGGLLGNPAAKALGTIISCRVNYGMRNGGES